jgi:hypothetical protein
VEYGASYQALKSDPKLEQCFGGKLMPARLWNVPQWGQRSPRVPRKIMHRTKMAIAAIEPAVSNCEECRVLSGPMVVATTTKSAMRTINKIRCFFLARV